MRLDGLALFVDPAVRPRLLDHGAEVALPGRILRDLGALAQRLLEDPAVAGVVQLRRVGQRAAGLVESGRAALDHQLEGAEVILVFERDAAIDREFEEHAL